jgi:hypothetical protein
MKDQLWWTHERIWINKIREDLFAIRVWDSKEWILVGKITTRWFGYLVRRLGMLYLAKLQTRPYIVYMHM